MNAPATKEEALLLVARCADKQYDSDENFKQAVAYATRFANYAEIAEASGWTRQGINQMVKRENLGNGVDKDDARV